MSWTFERVAGPFALTEGPVWDGTGLLFSDIPTSRILRYDPRTATCTVYRTDTHRANGLRMDAQGRIYACEGGLRARRQRHRPGRPLRGPAAEQPERHRH